MGEKITFRRLVEAGLVRLSYWKGGLVSAGETCQEIEETPELREKFLEELGDENVDHILRVLPPRSLACLFTEVEGGYQLEGIVADEIAPERLRFLWPNRFLTGKINLLVGDPGVGKSYLSLDLAARVSAARQWPDGNGQAPLGNVLIMSAEDSPSDTIRPRLEKAGADLDRCVIVGDIKGPTGQHAFNLNHMTVLEDLVKRTRPMLAVIDPIAAYMGKTDAHRDTEVRRVLAPLASMADRYGVCFLVVMHLNKKTDQPTPLYRVGGSIGFTGAARSVWMVGQDPDNEDRRILAPAKGNVLRNPTALGFSIVSEPGEDHGVVAWEREPVAMRPEDFLETEQEPGALTGAMDFLHETLSKGPLLSAELVEEADRKGIKSRTLKTARAKVGVQAVKVGSKFWVWLPGHGLKPGEESER